MPIQANAARLVKGTDTNKQIIIVTKNNAKKLYRKHKVFCKKVDIVPTDKSYNISWNKAKCAEGYQYIIRTEKSGVKTGFTTETEVKIPADGSDYKSVLIKVRPFIKGKKNKKIYGKWSGFYGCDTFCTHCYAVSVLTEKYGYEQDVELVYKTEMEKLMYEIGHPKN